jgi:hypothetical protein
LSRDSESKTVPNEADGIFYYELDELGWPQDRKVFALAIALGQGPNPANIPRPALQHLVQRQRKFCQFNRNRADRQTAVKSLRCHGISVTADSPQRRQPTAGGSPNQ